MIIAMALVRPTRSHSAEGGIALLAVMWTVTLLVLLALTFSNSVQIETRAAIYHKEAAQAHAMASGGVEAAILEIAYPAVSDQDRFRLWTWKNGQREVTVPFEGSKADLEIVNETGKVDLNAASREEFVRLFEARSMESTAAARLAAAIVHWRSPTGDDQESMALDDYYKQAGCRPAHAPFTSVEEALRVRGMTRDIFYGTVEVTEQGDIQPKYGVGQDLTVFSGSPQINVNYASQAALLAVPEITPDLARAIIRERRKEPFRSLSDLSERLSESLPDKSLAFLTTSTSQTYSIVSTGEIAGSRVRRTVRALVQVGGQGAGQYRLIAWYDNPAGD